ncbi:GTF2IRD2 [Cordylochernes scorpioides]|uniref:GTF2IRD2 n=1 Tax=Cordylochernes scorpioides TaxID=51811 RepID=A0ABY6KBI0_9ARAC|nr:GTF2IRD2 [Cordylochernes scorpioides]
MGVIDIQCDSDLKAKFIEIGVSEFYKYLPARFENTRKLAYEIMSMFGSTYRCEQLFSLMKGNKSPIKSRITDVHLGSVLKLITAIKISPEVGKMPVYNTKMTTKEPGKVMQTCKYCGKQLEYKSQLIDHEKTHTGEREFMCDWKGCDFRSNRKFNVAQHKVTHTEEKPFTCDHCPYRSAHKTHLRVHMRKHTDSKPYICDICGFKTSYCSSLKDHKRNKHTDPALKCKLCKYSAFGEVDLRSHTCDEGLCCGECGYRSQSRSHFIRHKEVHNSVLYSCSLCGTRSKSKTYFTKHMKNKHQLQSINIEEYATPATTSFDE